MNILIYWGVVFAGAATLLIEAYRNFNSSLTAIPFKEHPILKNMKVSQLCTTREKNIGFLFYSLLYLVTYTVILSSTEIFDLITEATRSSLEVGPTNTVIGTIEDPLKLLDAQYGKPIFISAAIIAIFSVGALRPIEGTMRSLSHRLAGVPRGVYAVIEDLHGISFDKFTFKDPTPLTNMFDENAAPSFANSYDADLATTIRTALRTIDYLAPAITGKLRIQYFPFTQLEAMGAMSDALELQVSQLRDTLKTPLSTDDTTRAKLFDSAMAVANDTIALFSVHFLRNNRAIKNFREESAIAEVYEKIKRDYQVELNSFAMGWLTAVLCTIFSAFLLYQNWVGAEQPIMPAGLTRVVAAAEDERVALGESDESCEENYPNDVTGLFDKQASEPTETHPVGVAASQLQAACLRSWENAAQQARAGRRRRSLLNAILQPLPVALGVAFAAISAIFGRDVRREDNSWPSWQLRRVPFMQLFTLSIIPAVLAVLGVTAGEFIRAWFEAGFQLTENEIAHFFVSKGPYFLMHACMGFIISLGVLVLSDQHDNHSVEVTFFLGFVLAAIALVCYYFVIIVGYPPAFLRPQPSDAWVSFEERETLIFGAVTFFFLIFYALFLELTESLNNKRRSMIGGILGFGKGAPS